MLESRDISLLRPDVAANCRRWLERCRMAGLKVLVTNTVRDREYQEQLYAQGRTRPQPKKPMAIQYDDDGEGTVGVVVPCTALTAP